MAYLGIGYTGEDSAYLRDQVAIHMQWLKGDRLPRFYGDRFCILYDSNTAREFAAKCRRSAPQNSIVVYPTDRPLEM